MLSNEWDYQHAERRADVALQLWMIENGIPLWPEHDLSVISLDEWVEQHGDVLDETADDPADMVIAMEKKVSPSRPLSGKLNGVFSGVLAALERHADVLGAAPAEAEAKFIAHLRDHTFHRKCAAPDCDKDLVTVSIPEVRPLFSSAQAKFCSDRECQRRRAAGRQARRRRDVTSSPSQNTY